MAQIHRNLQIKPDAETLMHANSLHFVCYPSSSTAVDTEA